jgi:hypothetical protein
MIESVYVTIFLAALSGTIWAIRLEGKVSENRTLAEARLNEHDQLFEERKKLADERQADLKAHLQRIEAKLDSIVYGALKKL